MKRKRLAWLVGAVLAVGCWSGAAAAKPLTVAGVVFEDFKRAPEGARVCLFVHHISGSITQAGKKAPKAPGYRVIEMREDGLDSEYVPTGAEAGAKTSAKR